MVFITGELASKRLELLRSVVPKGTTIAMLVNPSTPETEAERRDIQAAAQAIGQQLSILDVSSSREIETAFATLLAGGAGALLCRIGSFLFNSREQIVALSARHKISRDLHIARRRRGSCLMSYGTSISEAFRQAGIYAGRILKGEKPGELPVMQSTKFEFVLNLKTAKALELEIPPTLLALADEVIE